MDYSERYKADLVSALHNVDSGTVQRVVECLREARSRNRRILVCGGNGIGAGAQSLVDALRQAKPNKGQRLRVLNLNSQVPSGSGPEYVDVRLRDRMIVEELKTFAEPGDVVVGISGSGDPASVLNALEYASWINCRTIAISGLDDNRIAGVATINVRVSATHSATLHDAVMAVCHMIGCGFVDSCATEVTRTAESGSSG
jgi:D-sedoheptulose 7-phosphate isomerase